MYSLEALSLGSLSLTSYSPSGIQEKFLSLFIQGFSSVSHILSPFKNNSPNVDFLVNVSLINKRLMEALSFGLFSTSNGLTTSEGL
tara:strand:+ start:1424 stop:1681 length:258 start_codon:yes stop_codon:yes gene_type:complete